MLFDVELKNPRGNPETMFAVAADSVEEVFTKAPELLASSSQWRPDQFEVLSVRISIYEKSAEKKSELR